MILPINDQYRLAANPHGWTIEQKCVRKRRGVRRAEWTPIRWYSTLAPAVDGYAEFRLRVSGAKDVAEALGVVKRIAAELYEALQPIPHVIGELRIRLGKTNEVE